MLKIENLWIRYGNVEAVRGLSLEVKRNEIVALIGANGAGKSSTLMGISGMIPKSDGKIFFLDKDITDTKPKDIVKMGISHVPEGRHVFPDMTVEENIYIGSFGSAKAPSKEELKRKKEEMYTFFPRLYERRTQMAGTLSGGEQQMLAIARGLMASPELIIFDEPSLGLAPIIIEDVYEQIAKLKDNGTTILLVEQNASVALEVADRAYVIENGSIALTGNGEELRDNPDVKKAYLGM